MPTPLLKSAAAAERQAKDAAARAARLRPAAPARRRSCRSAIGRCQLRRLLRLLPPAATPTPTSVAPKPARSSCGASHSSTCCSSAGRNAGCTEACSSPDTFGSRCCSGRPETGSPCGNARRAQPPAAQGLQLLSRRATRASSSTKYSRKHSTSASASSGQPRSGQPRPANQALVSPDSRRSTACGRSCFGSPRHSAPTSSAHRQSWSASLWKSRTYTNGESWSASFR